MQNKALILVHGRGATAEGIRSFVTSHVSIPDDVLIFAPQAPGNAWYPHRFIEPKAANEPHLSLSLDTLDALVTEAQDQGIEPGHVTFFGFSQGACLISEYFKQNPRRYGGAVIASGGVIGTDEEAQAPGGTGSLAGTPVYLGCDHNDAHIPESRVTLTERVLSEKGAEVEMHLYNGLGHAVHPDALAFLSARIKG